MIIRYNCKRLWESTMQLTEVRTATMRAQAVISRLIIVALILFSPVSIAFGGEIYKAAEAGDLAKVNTLLEMKPKLANSKDEEGEFSLHNVAHNGARKSWYSFWPTRRMLSPETTTALAPVLPVAPYIQR